MGALLSTVRTVLNLLLPFTNQNTPLIQDLLHAALLCGTLYFAPQIAEHYQSHAAPPPPPPIEPLPDDPPADPTPDTPIENLPVEHDLVLQPDTDAEDEAEPPPHAPTPPPGTWIAPPPPPPPLDAAAGPANDRPRPTPANRVIGTKKAKSLARRDQRRAYHEWQREQAEARRREEEEGREEREAILAAEKARRAGVEREIVERERAERERRKEEARREQEAERERRERVVGFVRDEVRRCGALDLVGVAVDEDKDQLWIERLVRASGMLAQLEKEGEHVMITGDGWLVRLDAQLVREAYATAAACADANDGTVSFARFGTILEDAVRARAAAAA